MKAFVFSLLMLLALIPANALAGSCGGGAGGGCSPTGSSGAHFMKDTGDSLAANGALVVTIDEAGLGNLDVTYTVTADESATWACFNNGNNHPQASNKVSANAATVATGIFQPKNGRVQATLTGGPLGPGSFACPNGQRLELAAVGYANVVLTDTTNGVSITLADQSATLLDLGPGK